MNKQFLGLIDVLDLAKENPGKVYDGDGLHVSYEKEVNDDFSYWMIGGQQVYDRIGFKELPIPPEEGDWYRDSTRGNYYKVIDVYTDDYLKIQFLRGRISSERFPLDWTNADTKITDETELMFLEHGRDPLFVEHGDIISSLGSHNFMQVDNKHKIDTFYQRLICFKENRSDWKEGGE